MKNKIINPLLCLFVICAMIFTAEITHEKEIIFPEAAALCVGAFISPKLPWRVNGIRMVMCITICAVLGVLIVLYIPMPLYFQLALAYIVGQLVFIFSGTTLAPMISAIVLPVLLQTESVIYLIAAFTITLTIAVLNRNKTEFKSVSLPDKQQYIKCLLRAAAVIIFTFTAIKLNVKFCVAPPLLVAFTEFTNPESKAMKTPFKTISLVTLCAFIGAAARFIIVMQLQLPLTLAAFVSAALMIVTLKAIKLYIPPAGAMTVLAMLVPENVVLLYVPQVIIGVTVLFVTARLISKLKIRA